MYCYAVSFMYRDKLTKVQALATVEVACDDPRDAYVKAEDKLLAQLEDKNEQIVDLKAVCHEIVGPHAF